MLINESGNKIMTMRERASSVERKKGEEILVCGWGGRRETQKVRGDHYRGGQMWSRVKKSNTNDQYSVIWYIAEADSVCKSELEERIHWGEWGGENIP